MAKSQEGSGVRKVKSLDLDKRTVSLTDEHGKVQVHNLNKKAHVLLDGNVSTLTALKEGSYVTAVQENAEGVMEIHVLTNPPEGCEETKAKADK